MTASTGGSGGRVDGMANVSKPSSEASLGETSSRCCALQAKGLDQKVRDSEQDPPIGSAADKVVTGVEAWA